MTPLFLLVLASLLCPGDRQPALEGEAHRFAEAWVREDLRTLGAAMAPEGIRLHLSGEEHALILPRQARAAIGAFLERYSRGEVQVTRVSIARGDPAKGYSEIRWVTQAPGVTEPQTFTIFVAFSLREEAWQVTEIRVLF